LAFGTRKLQISHGHDFFEIPCLSLKIPRIEIVAKYKASFTLVDDDDGELRQPICDSHLYSVIDFLCGNKNTNLAALDSVMWKTCVENFKNLKFLIEIVTVNKENDKLKLIRLVDETEDFIKCIYPDHLS
jgi:hypothetical protein